VSRSPLGALIRLLTASAKVARDVNAVATGHVARRVRNRAIGRALGRLGVWRRLWR